MSRAPDPNDRTRPRRPREHTARQSRPGRPRGLILSSLLRWPPRVPTIRPSIVIAQAVVAAELFAWRSRAGSVASSGSAGSRRAGWASSTRRTTRTWQRMVAVKMVRVPGGDRSRALTEGRALARLSHVNVVPIYEVGFVGDQSPLLRDGAGHRADAARLGQGANAARDRRGLRPGRRGARGGARDRVWSIATSSPRTRSWAPTAACASSISASRARRPIRGARRRRSRGRAGHAPLHGARADGSAARSPPPPTSTGSARRCADALKDAGRAPLPRWLQAVVDRGCAMLPTDRFPVDARICSRAARAILRGCAASGSRGRAWPPRASSPSSPGRVDVRRAHRRAATTARRGSRRSGAASGRAGRAGAPRRPGRLRTIGAAAPGSRAARASVALGGGVPGAPAWRTTREPSPTRCSTAGWPASNAAAPP